MCAQKSDGVARKVCGIEREREREKEREKEMTQLDEYLSE